MAIVVALGLALRSAMAQVRTLTPPRRVVPPLDAIHFPVPLEPVSFLTADGLTIRGWYGDSRNGAVVLVLHGWSDTRASMVPEAKMLASAGFGVLLFDWRGHGESGGTHTTWGFEEQRDLDAALTWVERSHPGLRIGALGFSMGGMTLIEEASRDQRIRVIALEGMYPSLEDVAYQMQSTYGFLTGFPSIWAMRVFGPPLDAVRPVDRLCSLDPRPILLIYGSDEHAARYDLTRRMLGAVCGDNNEHWIVPHASHGQYAVTAPEELRRTLVDFFSRPGSARRPGLIASGPP
jgi:pimeloyl-ACP methyl ester carboxylesterase